MHLSWSHKLFLRVNELQGKHPVLDRLMVLTAHGLIAVLIANFVYFFAFEDAQVFFVTAGAYVLGFVLNYAIALLCRRERPVKELPQVRVLLQTLGTWKSFPSDHAMAVAIPATLSVLLHAPLYGIICLVGGALLVGVSRVYVGVHYPRDIAGGLLVGAVSAIVAYLVVG
jgi:undecaprenyl-diphosphatase